MDLRYPEHTNKKRKGEGFEISKKMEKWCDSKDFDGGIGGFCDAVSGKDRKLRTRE
jgi:hypothetical protein